MNEGLIRAPVVQLGQQNVLSRVARVEFPRFDGKDVCGWLYHCRQCFEVEGTRVDAKVKLASIHLEGRALLWHQSCMKLRGVVEWQQWEEYAVAVQSRFDDVPYCDPMAELKALRQEGTVQAYHDSFDSLFNKVDLPEHYAVSHFVSGLKEEIQLPVRMFSPITISHVVTLAHLQENTLAATQKRNQSFRNPPLFPTPRAAFTVQRLALMWPLPLGLWCLVVTEPPEPCLRMR